MGVRFFSQAYRTPHNAKETNAVSYANNNAKSLCAVPQLGRVISTWDSVAFYKGKFEILFIHFLLL
jgi:hypothetical protein